MSKSIGHEENEEKLESTVLPTFTIPTTRIQSEAEYCESVSASDREDCTNLFPGNPEVRNKPGCESLGCCHSEVTDGPWCFKAPWTVLKYCIKIQSSLTFDHNCGGGPIEIKRNGETVATMPAGYSSFPHCEDHGLTQDQFENDHFQLKSTNTDGVCITYLAVIYGDIETRIKAGKNDDLEAFWIDENDQNFGLMKHI